MSTKISQGMQGRYVLFVSDRFSLAEWGERFSEEDLVFRFSLAET